MKKLFLIIFISHGLIMGMQPPYGDAPNRVPQPLLFEQLDDLISYDPCIYSLIIIYQDENKTHLSRVQDLAIYELSKLSQEPDDQKFMLWSKRLHLFDIMLDRLEGPLFVNRCSWNDRCKREAIRLLLIGNKDEGSCFSWLPRELIREIGILVKNGFEFKSTEIKKTKPRLIPYEQSKPQQVSTVTKSDTDQNNQKITVLPPWYFSKMVTGVIGFAVACFCIARYIKQKNDQKKPRIQRVKIAIG